MSIQSREPLLAMNSSHHTRILIMLMLGFFCAQPLFAIRTQSADLKTYKEFAAGSFENMSLSHVGELAPAHALKKLADLNQAKVIFDAVSHGEYLFIATGDQGKVFRMDRDGNMELYFDSEEVMARALLVDEDGVLYVGTAPNGIIYRIEEDERPEIFFNTPADYVWDMAWGPERDLTIATGKPAHIYQISTDFHGKKNPEPLFKSQRDHMQVLEFDDEGQLYAGASPSAYLYRINQNGEADILSSGMGNEITDITIRDGEVLFSVFGSSQSNGGGKSSSSNPSAQQALVQKLKQKANGNGNGKAKKVGPVYRWSEDGFTDTYALFPGTNVYRFYHDKKSDRLLVGADKQGALFSFKDYQEWSLLHKLKDGGQISAFTKSDAGLYILTSNPSAVYQLQKKTAESRYVSKPFDAQQTAHWGRLHAYYADSTTDSDWKWETRTGNAPEPDNTWSDWTKRKNGKIDSAAGRYLQWRLSGKGKLSAVNKIQIYYHFQNAAPVISSIKILRVGVETMTLKSQKNQLNLKKILKDNGSQLKTSSDQPKTRRKIMITNKQGYMTATWKAEDPNDDELRYSLDIATANVTADQAEWVRLFHDKEAPIFSFNTQGYENGHYRFRITATDYLSNTRETSETGKKISEPFLIDNRAPQVDAKVKSEDHGDVSVVFHAEDKHSVIVKASYVFEGGKEVDLLPDDDLFDDFQERFSFSLEDLDPGTYSLVINTEDAVGNESSTRNQFVIQEKNDGNQ